MKTILKKLADFLLSIIVGISLWLGVMILFLPTTYIKSVNMKTYNNQEILDTIEDINRIAQYNVLGKSGIRGINIQEDDKFLDRYSSKDAFAIGLSIVTPWNCNIYIRSGLDALLLYQTTIHEIAHCFYFLHTNEENDLMYPSNGGNITYKNIEMWIYKIRDRELLRL